MGTYYLHSMKTLIDIPKDWIEFVNAHMVSDLKFERTHVTHLFLLKAIKGTKKNNKKKTQRWKGLEERWD